MSEIEAIDPWSHSRIRASRCWACGRDFVAGDAVRVVDAVIPKLVHDALLCADALTPLPHGESKQPTQAHK